VRVVVVVLDAPRLEGVDERHEHERAHDVLHQLVLAEAAVPGVVPDHEQLRSPHAQFAPFTLLHHTHAHTSAVHSDRRSYPVCGHSWPLPRCRMHSQQRFARRRRTPVHAVPANAHASGSRYHGEMEIKYTLSETDATVVATAPHARHMFSSNTCGRPQVEAWLGAQRLF